MEGIQIWKKQHECNNICEAFGLGSESTFIDAADEADDEIDD